MANDEFREEQSEARTAGLRVRNETRHERAIRRQVAEEIAAALEAVDSRTSTLACAAIARDICRKDAPEPPDDDAQAAYDRVADMCDRIAGELTDVDAEFNRGFVAAAGAIGKRAREMGRGE